MNLIELVAKSPEEIESYLGDVTTVQFIEDVKMSLSNVYDRKQAAMAAMQGILASYAGCPSMPGPESIAASSLKYADELLKQLES